MQPSRRKLLPHHHTGKLRHHAHTSYAGLAFIVMLAGVLLAGMSYDAMAAIPAVNPQAGSVGLTGRVKGPAPATAPSITAPGLAPGSHTSAIPIEVAGVCIPGTFVQVVKNGIFAGAAVCTADGKYSIQIDLFGGLNLILARLSDGLGQFGPDSGSISIYYDAPSFKLPNGIIGKQLFLQAATNVAGVSPGTALTRSATIVGGVGPYAISFDWGDGTNSLISQTTEGPVTSSHVYDRAGTYKVIVRVTDATGNTAFLQLVTVVNGPAEGLTTAASSGTGALPGYLLAAWPILGLAALMVLFFWLGERREAAKIRRRNQLLGNT